MYSRPMCGQGVVRKQRQATWTKNALSVEAVGSHVGTKFGGKAFCDGVPMQTWVVRRLYPAD